MGRFLLPAVFHVYILFGVAFGLIFVKLKKYRALRKVELQKPILVKFGNSVH